MPEVITRTRSPRNPPESRAADVSRGSSARRRKNGKTYGKRGKSKSGDDLFSPIHPLDIEDSALNEEEELEEEEVDDIEEEDYIMDYVVEEEDEGARARGPQGPEQESQDRNTDGDDDDDASSDEEGLIEQLFISRGLLSTEANEGGGGEEDEAADSDDAPEGDSAGGRRQSKRIKEKAKRQSKHLEQTKKTNKKARKDAIKKGDWNEYTIASLTEKFKNAKGFYVAELPDGTFKFGFIYSEGQTGHCLSKRLRQLVSTIIGAIWVRFIDTGDALSEQGVRMMETIAKFSFFVLTTTNGDGVTQSRYCGALELFEGSRDLCDDLLDKLVVYARDGKFRLKPGNGIPIITAKSVETKAHQKWRDYVYKTHQGRHGNVLCPWYRGDQEGLGAEYLERWINFSRDPTSTCPCIARIIPGVENIGNTCYLSAMLQIMFCVPDFLSDVHNIYVSEDEEGEEKRMPLTEALLDVATTLGLLDDNHAEVADPSALKAAFDAITQQMLDDDRNPSVFATGSEHDPHEFWVCFLNYWKEEHLDLESLIDDYFNLEVEEGRSCDNCDDYASSIVVDPLSVAIGDNAEDEPLSIEDLVDNHFQNEGNVYFHHSRKDGGCGRRTTATKSTKITKCPKALLVHIKRFDAENQKNEARIHLTNTLSLPHHENDNDNCNYRLCGVLNHIGGSVDNGHCTAITKKGEQWVHYNDAVGTKRSISFFTGNEYKQRQCYMALYIQ